MDIRKHIILILAVVVSGGIIYSSLAQNNELFDQERIVIDYSIAWGNNGRDLTEKVRSMLNQGWQVYGEAQIALRPSDGTDQGVDMIQTMVKYSK